jgi:hypothetical protein
VEAFLDRYYPEPQAPGPSAEGASGNAKRLTGSYRPTRSNQTGFEKFVTLQEEVLARFDEVPNTTRSKPISTTNDE